MTLQEFVVRVAEAQCANPHWRHGQAVSNVFAVTHSPYFRALWGSKQDPYYDDALALPAILQAVARGVLRPEEL